LQKAKEGDVERLTKACIRHKTITSDPQCSRYLEQEYRILAAALQNNKRIKIISDTRRLNAADSCVSLLGQELWFCAENKKLY
jgi:hypothetical protein